jgi:hypothetical protein
MNATAEPTASRACRGSSPRRDAPAPTPASFRQAPSSTSLKRRWHIQSAHAPIPRNSSRCAHILYGSRAPPRRYWALPPKPTAEVRCHADPLPERGQSISLFDYPSRIRANQTREGAFRWPHQDHSVVHRVLHDRLLSRDRDRPKEPRLCLRSAVTAAENPVARRATRHSQAG